MKKATKFIRKIKLPSHLAVRSFSESGNEFSYAIILTLTALLSTAVGCTGLSSFMLESTTPGQGAPPAKQTSDKKSDLQDSYLNQSSSDTKTICSITINSSDEIEAFKRKYRGPQYRFIELTDIPDSYEKRHRLKDGIDHYLENYCREDIRCDVLVISGHFGGTFTGDKGKSLSQSDMLNLSCRQECRGIFRDPKEVFLFGCNTLAGKNKDARSPEVYAQVLIDHGYSRSEALTQAALRYEPVGESFAEQMQAVFSSNAKIYGFPSVSARGTTNADFLKDYFQSIPSYSDYLDGLRPEKAPEKNQAFIRAFRGVTGIQLNGYEGPERKLQCDLSQSHLTSIQVLQKIDQALKMEMPARFVPTVQRSIHRHREVERLFDEQSRSLEKLQTYIDTHFDSRTGDSISEWMSDIRENQEAKKSILPIIKDAGKILPSNALDLTDFASLMGWIDQKQLRAAQRRIFFHMQEGGPAMAQARMCLLGQSRQMYFTAKDFNSQLWKRMDSSAQLRMMNCLPINHEASAISFLFGRMQIALENKDLGLARSIIYYFEKILEYDNKSSYQALIELLKNSPASLRQSPELANLMTELGLGDDPF